MQVKMTQDEKFEAVLTELKACAKGWREQHGMRMLKEAKARERSLPDYQHIEQLYQQGRVLGGIV